VAALRERGVDWLAPSDAAGAPLDDETLLARLAAHADPRLRLALIGLFLLHPHLAAHVPRVREQLERRAADELAAHYMAAAYLQKEWSIRLRRFLGPVGELPDLFSVEQGLPAPSLEHAPAGLAALAEWHARQSLRPTNQLSAYEGVADLLFQSLKSKRRPRELAAER
jgi:hypothetical protein